MRTATSRKFCSRAWSSKNNLGPDLTTVLEEVRPRPVGTLTLRRRATRRRAEDAGTSALRSVHTPHADMAGHGLARLPPRRWP